jgi:hypothetical protein
MDAGGHSDMEESASGEQSKVLSRMFAAFGAIGTPIRNIAANIATYNK